MTARYGFSKQRRLRKTDEISSVFDFRCRETGHYLSVLAKPTATEGPRIVVMVSKKISLLACARNYMRRRIRETFRVKQHELPKLDIVVRVIRRFETKDAATALAELDHHFARLTRCQKSSAA